MSGGNQLGVLAEVRWPLEPLLRYTGMTQVALARRLGVHATTVQNARRRGLNDRQADHWATAIGLHPALIWGPEWFEAAPPEGVAS